MTKIEANETFSSFMLIASNYNHWLIQSFKSYLSKQTLEIGIGHGGFYPLIKDSIESYTGLDIDPMLIEQAKKHYPNQNYYLGDITSLSIKDTLPQLFDTVLCCNVLEHIENDRLGLCNMLSLLKPGGHLLLFVPAFEALYNDMDQLAGHHRRYTKRTLSSAIPKEKGEIVLLKYFNAVGGIGWWCNKFVSHQTLGSQRIGKQVLLFDKLLVPIAKMADVVMSRFFGQSVVCVIRKLPINNG